MQNSRVLLPARQVPLKRLPKILPATARRTEAFRTLRRLRKPAGAAGLDVLMIDGDGVFLAYCGGGSGVG